MDFEALLVHQATIQQRVERLDRYRQPVLDGWEDKAQVACRLTPPKGGERYTDRTRGVVVADYVVYMLPNASVGEADRLSEVMDEAGTVLAQNLEILLVRRECDLHGRLHHLELPCRVHREQASGA